MSYAEQFEAGMAWLKVLETWPLTDPATVRGARKAAAAVPEDGEAARLVSPREGYQRYAPTYGDSDTPVTAIEGELVRRLAGSIPRVDRFLDAGCGAGRHSGWLAERHGQVIGVDLSSDMLARAAARGIPGAEWLTGDIREIPLADNWAHAALSSLTVGHLPELEPAIAELARVVRPGGRIVLAELHPQAVSIGGHLLFQDGADMLVVPKYPHLPSTYMNAFRKYGLQIDGCYEPCYTVEALGQFELQDPEGYIRAALTGWPAVLAWELTVM